MPGSEVAQLMQRIQEEYTAAHYALYAPAIVAKHEFITKRLENMQKAQVQLQAIIGAEAAIKLVAETLETVEIVRNS